MQSDVNDLRTEMNQKFDDIRGEMNQKFDDVREEMDITRTAVNYNGEKLEELISELKSSKIIE